MTRSTNFFMEKLTLSKLLTKGLLFENMNAYHWKNAHAFPQIDRSVMKLETVSYTKTPVKLSTILNERPKMSYLFIAYNKDPEEIYAVIRYNALTDKYMVETTCLICGIEETVNVSSEIKQKLACDKCIKKGVITVV